MRIDRWKELWRDDCMKAISGFANAEGGTLFIGRNDSGDVVGVKDARKLLEDLPNKVRDILGIVVDVYLDRLSVRSRAPGRRRRPPDGQRALPGVRGEDQEEGRRRN